MSALRSYQRRLGAFAAGCVLVAGCATGERPVLEEDTSTGTPEIDTVLELLKGVNRSEFTVGYQIETKFNSVSSTGLVVQASGPRRSITVENDERTVRFITDGAEELTCDLLASTCETSLNDARISDTQLSHSFYGPAFERRLIADALRQVGPPSLYDKEIAGQSATCVDVMVTGGTKTYCALESGPLAEFVGADVTIELTSYSPEPDETKFESS